MHEIFDEDLDRFYEPSDVVGCCSQCEEPIRDSETHFQSGGTLICMSCARDNDLAIAMFDKLGWIDKLEALGFEEVY